MDLNVDYQELRTASATVRQAFGVLASVRPVPPETAALTGHARLAATIMTFSDAWDAARGRVLSELEFIADGLHMVADRLEVVDLGLAGHDPAGAARTGEQP